MAFRILLDTNILLDFTLKREGYKVARQLMEWAVQGRVQVFITPGIMQMTGYWLAAAYGAVKAKEILLALLSDVRVIDVGHEIAVNALHSRIPNMEDALQYYTALHHKLDYFISREPGMLAAAIPVLPVCSPEAFLHNNK